VLYNFAMSRNIEFGVEEFYHIYNRGVEKRKIFLDQGDYDRFTRLLYSANSNKSVHLSNHQGRTLLEVPRGKLLVSIGAWCLMPNHFHLLVREVDNSGISLFMQKLMTGYTMYFNKKYHRTGTLFESRFRAKHLHTDEYVKYQYAYIHLNPIGTIDSGWKNKKIRNVAKARKIVRDYKYSSYRDCSGVEREENCILNKEDFPVYFDSTRDFDSMLEEWLNFDEAHNSNQ
jgi:putative transposase